MSKNKLARLAELDANSEVRSLDNYQNLPANALTGKRHAAEKAVIDAVYALVLQREFLGFTDRNIEWVQSHFQVPPSILNRLGDLT